MLFYVVGFTFQPNRTQSILGIRTRSSARLEVTTAKVTRRVAVISDFNCSLVEYFKLHSPYNDVHANRN